MTRMLVVFAVAAASSAVTAYAQSPAPDAGLAGAWRLDPQRSEDAREKMRAQREKERQRDGMQGRGGFGGGGHGGWGGHGGGFGGRGGGRGGRRDGASFDAMRDAMDSILDAPESMALTVGQGEVEIAGKDGRIRRLRSDGRKLKHEDPPSESLTRWEGQTLVNETWLGNGGTHIVEAFALDQGTRELVVSLRIENRRFGGEPITVKRVYVPDVPASPAPSSGSGAR